MGQRRTVEARINVSEAETAAPCNAGGVYRNDAPMDPWVA